MFGVCRNITNVRYFPMSAVRGKFIPRSPFGILTIHVTTYGIGTLAHFFSHRPISLDSHIYRQEKIQTGTDHSPTSDFQV